MFCAGSTIYLTKEIPSISGMVPPEWKNINELPETLGTKQSFPSFGFSVLPFLFIYLVIWVFIYLVLWIRSTVPDRLGQPIDITGFSSISYYSSPN